MSPLQRVSAGIDRLELHDVGRTLALSSLVGVVAGGGAILFQYLVQGGASLFLGALAGYEQSGPVGEAKVFHLAVGLLHPWRLPLVVALGGLITGIIVRRFAPEAAGHGTDEAIDAYHRRAGVIRGRVPFVKTIASAITLGAGGSGGREGPIAQIGAGFGSFLATRLGLPERERRILLAAGVGAGVGSIFRAPLAGALFAAEVLYSDPEFESDAVIPAAISTIVAYCVFSLKFGFGALFLTPHFTFRSPLELLPYTVLALVVALGAGLFVKVFYGTHALFQRLPLPPVWRPAVGGLLTGLVAIALYFGLRDVRALDVMSFGYGSVQEAMLGHLPVQLLLWIAVGKLLTTSLSIGSGGSGGVFGPSMVIGGTLGGAVGLLFHQAFPDLVTQPGAFVPVGMAGFFSAAANTPISTLVMVSEMTGNYELLLPSLWVCALSFLIGRRWKLYRNQVSSRAHSPAHRDMILVGALRGMRVGDVLTPRAVRTVPQTAPLSQVLDAFMASPQYSFPVVDRDGRMTGIIQLVQIRSFMDEPERGVGVIAYDVANQPPRPLTKQDDLAAALERMLELDTEELPVVAADEPQKVVGMISRRDILAVYGRKRMEMTGAVLPARD